LDRHAAQADVVAIQKKAVVVIGRFADSGATSVPARSKRCSRSTRASKR
jgi:hypothetical protein